MCLTIPKQVISLNKDFVKPIRGEARTPASAISNGVKINNGGVEENAISLINVKKGDWVLTQNGVIIKKINKKQAEDILDILDKYNTHA